MWRKWWAPNNASKQQMGFNSGFKGLIILESFGTKLACLLKWENILNQDILTGIQYVYMDEDDTNLLKHHYHITHSDSLTKDKVFATLIL